MPRSVRTELCLPGGGWLGGLYADDVRWNAAHGDVRQSGHPTGVRNCATLHNLAAYTCPPSSCEGEFLVARWLDYATSTLTYRV